MFELKTLQAIIIQKLVLNSVASHQICFSHTQVPEVNLRQSSSVATISVYVRDGLLGEPHAYILWGTKDIQLETAKVETFIETDKPLYIPGQTGEIDAEVFFI